MDLELDKYYHLYNRTNNNEVAFHSEENYRYFLSKFQKYLTPHVSAIAYCLMPTHFHFLIQVKTEKKMKLQNAIGILQSSYTKALNIERGRHGYLFQKHTNARTVEHDEHLDTLIAYIDQNPVRSKLVAKPGEWEFSSYNLYAGVEPFNIAAIVKKAVIEEYFPNSEEFKEFSNEMIVNPEEERPRSKERGAHL